MVDVIHSKDSGCGFEFRKGHNISVMDEHEQDIDVTDYDDVIFYPHIPYTQNIEKGSYTCSLFISNDNFKPKFMKISLVVFV